MALKTDHKGGEIMAQPWAIYASIPASTGAEWLVNPPNIAPVAVVNPYSYWPNVDWSDGNLNPTSGYGEIPEYLWSVPVPDPDDNTAKTFTRRITAGTAMTIPNILKLPVGGDIGNKFRMLLSIAADDEYTFQLLINGSPIPGEVPTTGFNFQVPFPLPWRNVKTFSFGTGAQAVTLHKGDTLDIQTTVTNLPQARGIGNLAMVTWTLQIFSCSE
jgi:hypothetical protein